MIAIPITIAVLSILISAWLRAAGTAITRIPRADALRDASDEVKGAGTVAELLDKRENIVPAVGVVASAFLVVGAVIAAAIFARETSAAGAILIAGVVGLVSFLLGDLIPRRLGRLNPRGLAYRSHLLLRWSVGVGGWANELLPDVDDGVEEEDEIDEGEADEHERELIDSVLEFGETIVREVMTPRPDMVTIPATGTIQELIALSTDEGYSRIPVTSNGDVVGMVIVKDLLPMLTNGVQRDTVAEVMRSVDFVPETKLAASLLAEMQDSHIHQVMVVDEYGDVVGLVTIEDLLEELVGEIADETDPDEALVVAQGADRWWVDARLGVDELCKLTGIEAPDDYEGDTVGGLVLGLAERVPEEGEVFVFERLAVEVIRMQGRRVAEVMVGITERAESQ